MDDVKASNQRIIHTAHNLANISAWMLVIGVMLPCYMIMVGVEGDVRRLALMPLVTVPISALIFWCGWRMLGRLRDE